jgi:DNA polymerase III sliding clamp (beta) subunit (PCNA family)
MKTKVKKLKVKKKVQKIAQKTETTKSPKIAKKQKPQKSLKTKSEGLLYEKKETLEILQAIKPGLAIKDIVESMTNFYFSGTTVVTYNDKISISYPFVTDFQGFVRADTLYNLIAKLPHTAFKLKQDDNSIKLISKGVNVTLPSIEDSEVTDRITLINNEIENVKWKKVPENFSESISICSFAASKSETESTISCVYVDTDKCVATDSKRIAFAKLSDSMKPMFIKASEVKHLVKIDPIYYGLSKGWLFFKNKIGSIFSMRKIEGDFPAWEKLFDFEGKTIELPKNILQGIDLATVFTQIDHSATLGIIIENNLCHILISTEGGNLKYKQPVKYDGEQIKFVVNPEFLKEMLKHSTVITFSDKRAKLETETYSILTALYSTDEDE